MSAAHLLRDYEQVVADYRERLEAALAREPGVEESGARVSIIVPPPAPISAEASLLELAASLDALSGRLAWASADLDRLPHDPSSRAALGTVTARLSDVGDARDALGEMLSALSAAGAPRLWATLRYLEGALRWALQTTDELTTLAYELVDGCAEWPSLRVRLALAKSEWPTELEVAAGAELESEELAIPFAELTFVLGVLSSNLEQRFG